MFFGNSDSRGILILRGTKRGSRFSGLMEWRRSGGRGTEEPAGGRRASCITYGTSVGRMKRAVVQSGPVAFSLVDTSLNFCSS